MSDVFDNVDNLKFKDRIRVCSTSPHLKRDFVNENKIALSISVTNSFLVQLREAHERTLLSYLYILNSQLPNFQFKITARLETHFSLLANKAHRDLRTKFRSGRKRKVYLTSANNVAVFENELENVKELNSFWLTSVEKISNLKKDVRNC